MSSAPTLKFKRRNNRIAVTFSEEMLEFYGEKAVTSNTKFATFVAWYLKAKMEEEKARVHRY